MLTYLIITFCLSYWIFIERYSEIKDKTIPETPLSEIAGFLLYLVLSVWAGILILIIR